MYAIVDYKGRQILLEEGKKTRVPYIKDSKVGSNITFENILFFDDGKQKKVGDPFLKNITFKAKVISHERDSKISVFKQKRRKGHQKKNGYRDHFTLITIDKLSAGKQTKTKKTEAVSKTKPTTKVTSKKVSSKTGTTAKKNTKTKK